MFTTLVTSKLAALGIAGALTLGAVGGGVAYAHQRPSDDTTPVAFQQAAREKPGIFRNLMADIIKQSGLPKANFAAGFKKGESINDILTANQKDPKSVEAAVLSDVDAKIQDAVTSGKITAEQGQKLTDKAPGVLDKLFAAAPKHAAARQKIVELGKKAIADAAGVIGISPKELAQDMRNGQTIAQVAGDKTQAVTDKLTADAQAAIDKALADGKITQQQHDRLSANVGKAVSHFVNDVHGKGKAPATGNSN